MKKMLRDYQQAACDAVLASDDRALIVLACGTGKTVVAAHLGEKWRQTIEPSPRILFLCHLVDALYQAREEFETHMPGITTALFGAGEVGEQTADVVFATMQTFHRGTMEKFDPDHFDVIIVDEAHHAMATTYRGVIEYFHPHFLLGLTATPDRRDGLNIEDLFGDPVYEYGLAAALADGKWLSPVDYRVVTGEVNLAVLRDLAKRVKAGDRRITLADIDRTVFVQEKLEATIERIVTVQVEDDRQTIVYCRNLAHLERVYKAFKVQYPELRVATYHSQLKRNTLRKRYEAYKNGYIRVMLVVDKFNEAVNIPEAGLLVFLRLTDSWTVFEQQLGRGLRLSETHPDTIVLDFVGNCRRLQHLQNFRQGQTTNERAYEHQKMLDLSGHGAIWFEEEGIELLDLVALISARSFYPTLAEASAAAKRLGFLISDDYRSGYQQDTRLHSNPNKLYKSEWKGWRHFLTGLEPIRKYPTLDEAAAAVQRIGITSLGEYQDQYQIDPRLPSTPPEYYSTEWKSWPNFFGTEKYQSYESASAAAQRLGIPTSTRYKEGDFKKDRRLPSNPWKRYKKDWKGWAHFLGQRNS